MECHISSIMQSGFNEPVFASHPEHFRRSSLFSHKAGHAKLDFTTGFISLALTYPREFTFQAINLADPRPIQIIIEHLTGLNGASFDAAMSIADLFGGQKVSRNLAKPRFGRLGSEQALDRLIHLGLVLLDWPQIVPVGLENLFGNGALGRHPQ